MSKPQLRAVLESIAEYEVKEETQQFEERSIQGQNLQPHPNQGGGNLE